MRQARKASLLKVTGEFEQCFVPNQISCPKRIPSLSFAKGPMTEMSQKADIFEEKSGHLKPIKYVNYQLNYNFIEFTEGQFLVS